MHTGAYNSQINYLHAINKYAIKCHAKEAGTKLQRISVGIKVGSGEGGAFPSRM